MFVHAPLALRMNPHLVKSDPSLCMQPGRLLPRTVNGLPGEGSAPRIARYGGSRSTHELVRVQQEVQRQGRTCFTGTALRRPDGRRFADLPNDALHLWSRLGELIAHVTRRRPAPATKAGRRTGVSRGWRRRRRRRRWAGRTAVSGCRPAPRAPPAAGPFRRPPIRWRSDRRTRSC